MVLIKVCLNGGRLRADHPSVPLTAAELAADAASAVAAGASAVHMHARTPDGAETLDAVHIAEAMLAVRAACPGVPLGVSTGLWISDGDPDRRRRTIATWADLEPGARPDFASVNVGEPGSMPLAAQLLDLGIDVEAGVWSTEDADALRDSGLAPRCLRVLVELIGVPPAVAPDLAARIMARLDELDVRNPRLLHGDEASTWPMVELAARLGLATRIGLEDTVTGPSGERVHGNADLVRLARAV